ncbi:hypothetical protein [Streptomyces lunaelactis]|uniref:hypothetical protein n=1 Tax=Streptomyces lunaelactis TaxID=1535768 RepID=UPI001584DAB8|nr:hypothetical protein [Streptomyces lunaelactis]NUK27010.1 hypothetical protein [Streptomyces lunaelactis]
MEATQQPPYAPGLGDQWQYPGYGQGQTWQVPAAAPEEPIGRDERAQQLRDLGDLGVRFPLWFFWFRGRRWSATWTMGERGERVEANSAAEIAARLGATGGAPASPPVTHRTVPPPVVQRASQGGPQPPDARAAPPVNGVHPSAAEPARVPRMVQQMGQRGSPQAGQPWHPQGGPQQPPPQQRQAQPIQS